MKLLTINVIIVIMKKLRILLGIIVLILVAIGGYWVYYLQVARSSLNNVTFDFPKTLTTNYIHAQDWPPMASILPGPFTCTQAGSEIAVAGKTELKTINGHSYCVTIETQGAAGSIYTQYAYAFPKNDKVIIFTFTLRSVQCDNYDDPQKTACKKERDTFSVDNLVDSMAVTTKFSEVMASSTSLINVTFPKPNDQVTSPLVITGEARGNWFFEASFPVTLTNWDGEIISQGIAQAQGDWMTTDFVPFTATLDFTKPAYGNYGFLILKKDNPSGLTQNDAAVEIPILF